jgi:hypothetical protein
MTTVDSDKDSLVCRGIHAMTVQLKYGMILFQIKYLNSILSGKILDDIIPEKIWDDIFR